MRWPVRDDLADFLAADDALRRARTDTTVWTACADGATDPRDAEQLAANQHRELTHPDLPAVDLVRDDSPRTDDVERTDRQAADEPRGEDRRANHAGPERSDDRADDGARSRDPRPAVDSRTS